MSSRHAVVGQNEIRSSRVDSDLHHRLEAQAALGGQAYVRILAAAEATVLWGQFNLAKVPRALAHSQRAQAMGAAARR
jgi:hypothetical protein